MANISAVGGVNAGMSRVELEAELQVAVLSKQKEVIEDLGEQQVRMIEQAGIQGQGQRIDISI